MDAGQLFVRSISSSFGPVNWNKWLSAILTYWGGKQLLLIQQRTTVVQNYPLHSSLNISIPSATFGSWPLRNSHFSRPVLAVQFPCPAILALIIWIEERKIIEWNCILQLEMRLRSSSWHFEVERNGRNSRCKPGNAISSICPSQLSKIICHVSSDFFWTSESHPCIQSLNPSLSVKLFFATDTFLLILKPFLTKTRWISGGTDIMHWNCVYSICIYI